MAKLNMEQVAYWLKEAEACEDRHKKEVVQRNNYPLLVKYYEGKQYLDADGDDRMAQQEVNAIINEYFPNTNALISEIMFKNPDIVTEANKEDAKAGADLVDQAIESVFEETDAIIENRIALFDMIYAGYSAVEVNHIKDNKNKTVIDNNLEEREGIIDKAKRKLTGSVEEKEERKLEDSQSNEEKYASEDMTYIRRWSPMNVLLDYRAERLKDVRYIVKKRRMSKAEFDVEYPKFKDKVTPNESIDYVRHDNEDYKKCVTVYEFEIKTRNGREVLVVTPGYKETSLDHYVKENCKTFSIKVGTLSKYGVLYPISYAQQNKRLQDELHEYIVHMMDVAQRNIPKFVIDKDKVGEDGKTALTSKFTNDLVEVDGATQNSVIPLQPTQVSNENKELMAMFTRQKEKMWTISESRMSGNSDAKFMGELEIQEAGFMARQTDIQEGLRMLIKEEAMEVLRIINEYWTPENWFKVIGDEPGMLEPVVNLETGEVAPAAIDLVDDSYAIKVDIASAMRPNSERKKKDLIEFATWMTSPNVVQILMATGVNPKVVLEAIKKVASQHGVSEEMFEAQEQSPNQGMPQEGMPGQEGQMPPELAGLMGGQNAQV